MYCRRELDSEESISDEIKPYREIFLGNIMGVVLRNRKKDDPHVVFQIISEDDEYWFLSTNSSSSHWLEDYRQVLAEVDRWCNENCEPDMYKEIQCGWKFKTLE